MSYPQLFVFITLERHLVTQSSEGSKEPFCMQSKFGCGFFVLFFFPTVFFFLGLGVLHCSKDTNGPNPGTSGQRLPSPTNGEESLKKVCQACVQHLLPLSSKETSRKRKGSTRAPRRTCELRRPSTCTAPITGHAKQVICKRKELAAGLI